MAAKKKRSAIDQLLCDVEQEFEGQVSFKRASDVEYIYDLRRPTGILSLDLKIAGGWPAGTLNQVFGPDAVGKNYLMYSTAAQVQENYGNDAAICVVSLGYGFDPQHARNSGFRIGYTDEELKHVRQQYERAGEDLPDEVVKTLTYQPGEVIVIELGEGEGVDSHPTELKLQSVERMVRSNLFQLVLVDEAVGAGPSKDALLTTMGNKIRMGDQARMLSEFCRRYFNAIAPRGGVANRTTSLLASQARMDLKSKFKTFQTSGGMALAHTKAIDVHLTAFKPLRNKKQDKVGKEISWKIDKAKLGSHEGYTGKIPFWFHRQGYVDHVEDVCRAAKDLELIKNRGALCDIFDARGVELHKGIRGGFAGVVEMVRGKEDLIELLRQEAITKSGVRCRVT